jgi:2-C-methyl-D-erythritol 2,4-cyclodiphosphate synthase
MLKYYNRVCERLGEEGFEIVNIDSTVLAQAPKLRPYIDTMREHISHATGIPVNAVSVKATTEEGLGFTGAGLGIAANCICLIK